MEACVSLTMVVPVALLVVSLRMVLLLLLAADDAWVACCQLGIYHWSLDQAMLPPALDSNTTGLSVLSSIIGSPRDLPCVGNA